MNKLIKPIESTDNTELEAFEDFINNTDNVVRVGFTLSQLTGKGTEYLVVNGIITARFFNGDLIQSPQAGNKDDTKGVI
jgi:hypothetical protein